MQRWSEICETIKKRQSEISNAIKDKEVKINLPRFEWKEIFIFFSFLLLSFAFWVMQTMQEEYETQLVLPLDLSGLPRDLTLGGEQPVFTVRIRDKGSALLNYKFSHKKAKITLALQNGVLQKRRLRLNAKDIETLLLAQLSPTSSLLSFTPQSINLGLQPLGKRKLPVRFNGLINPAPGYTVSGDLHFVPPQVEVYGGEGLLDSLQEVQTVYTEFDAVNKNVKRRLRLQAVAGLRFSRPDVSIEVPVEAFTEKQLNIPLHCLHVPTGFVVRLFPQQLRVSCNVPLSRFKGLTPDDFAAEVSLDSLEWNSSGLLAVHLRELAHFKLEHLRYSPDSVEFVLERQ
jgi:hypothetical protein